MIKIKHLLDAVESDDGQRLWVEPIGVTADLRQWCAIDHVLSQIGPPINLWLWFQQHPDGYEYFRAKYHEFLSHENRRQVMMELAAAALQQDFTLVHQGDDPQHNSATALYEFLTELQAYVRE
ncbi:MAG TPA: DUF488 family protein [Tepidisphaeraceae bacterium]|nr:DUF488 family protein [Tepidisphaeraceae bacterium]